jgi:hypothetical protein
MEALGNLLGASMRFPCQTAHRSCNTEIALFQLTIWPAHNRLGVLLCDDVAVGACPGLTVGLPGRAADVSAIWLLPHDCGGVNHPLSLSEERGIIETTYDLGGSLAQ